MRRIFYLAALALGFGALTLVPAFAFAQVGPSVGSFTVTPATFNPRLYTNAYNVSYSLIGATSASGVTITMDCHAGLEIFQMDDGGNLHPFSCGDIAAGGVNGYFPSGVGSQNYVFINGTSQPITESIALSAYYMNTAVRTVTIPSYTSPSITVISPNGGEMLQEGNTYTIRWTDQNLPANAQIAVEIFNGTRGTILDPNSTIVTGLSASTTSYTWTIHGNNGWGVGATTLGQKLASLLGIKQAYADTNQYKIGVEAFSPTTGSLAFDASDNTFTINTATTTVLTKPPAPTCVVISTNLQYGSTGTQVVLWQNYLKSRGYSIGTDVSGNFGFGTILATIQFQKAAGISPATGYVGPLTRAYIAGHCSNPTPVIPGCPPGALYNSLTGAPCTTSSGPLTVGIDPSNPTSGLHTVDLANGAQDVPVLVFNAQSSGEDSRITSVTATVKFTMTPPSTLYLYQGNTLLGSQSVDINTSSVTFNHLNFVVPNGNTMPFTLSVDMPAGALNNSAVYVGLTDITYTRANGTSVTITPNLSGNNQYFSTVNPNFTFVSSTASAGPVDQNGNTQSISGTFTLRVHPQGGSMRQPVASDFSILVGSTQAAALPVPSSNIAIVSISPTPVSSTASLSQGTDYTITLTAVAQKNLFHGTDLYQFYITGASAAVNGVSVSQQFNPSFKTTFVGVTGSSTSPTGCLPGSMYNALTGQPCQGEYLPNITRVSAPAAEDFQVYPGVKFAIEGTNLFNPANLSQTKVYFADGDSATITQQSFESTGSQLIWAVSPTDLTPGTTVLLHVSNMYGTSQPVKVTVEGNGIAPTTNSPSATIDPGTLTTGFSNPTISGTAANTPSVVIATKGIPSVVAPVVNGHWSAAIPIYTSGSYAIEVLDSMSTTILASGTLTITPRTTVVGDLNGDGVVNQTDLTLFNQIPSGTTIGSPLYNAKADLNGDGVINFSDLLILSQHLAPTTTAAPTPSPTASPSAINYPGQTDTASLMNALQAIYNFFSGR